MSSLRRSADVSALYSALNAARAASDLSWRDIAKQTGLSPSLFSRMASNHSPDVDGWLTLCAWLRVPAETFVVVDSEDDGAAPSVSAQVAVLLARRTDLNDLDREYLTSQIAAYEKWRGRVAS